MGPVPDGLDLGNCPWDCGLPATSVVVWPAVDSCTYRVCDEHRLGAVAEGYWSIPNLVLQGRDDVFIARPRVRGY
jgi:hypothetical protein